MMTEFKKKEGTGKRKESRQRRKLHETQTIQTPSCRFLFKTEEISVASISNPKIHSKLKNVFRFFLNCMFTFRIVFKPFALALTTLEMCLELYWT